MGNPDAELLFDDKPGASASPPRPIVPPRGHVNDAGLVSQADVLHAWGVFTINYWAGSTPGEARLISVRMLDVDAGLMKAYSFRSRMCRNYNLSKVGLAQSLPQRRSQANRS